jgi:hypothetical protein
MPRILKDFVPEKPKKKPKKDPYSFSIIMIKKEDNLK